MHTPKSMNLAQFVAVLAHLPLTRTITGVHVHHTGRPTHIEWRGAASLKAMRRYSVPGRGFRDVAQHLTVDPSGGLWMGRDWNLPPASNLSWDPITSAPSNGTGDAGPLMIEMVGNFDIGGDRLDGAQRDAMAGVLGAVCVRFQLATGAVHAHASLQGGITCPGSSLFVGAAGATAWDQLLRDANATIAGMSTALASARALAPAAGYASVRALTHVRSAVPLVYADGLPAEAGAPEDCRGLDVTFPTGPGSTDATGAPRGAVDPRFGPIEPHVVNTAQGLLFDDTVSWSLRVGGRFTSTPRDLEDFVLGPLGFERYVARQRSLGAPVRLLLHAHGGLVSEKAALEYALAHYDWWLSNGIYPVFMVWETDFLQTVFGHRRGIGEALANISDGVIEGTTAPLASVLWERMKANAARCSSTDWHADVVAEGLTSTGADGHAIGGARVFARALAQRIARLREDDVTVDIHAVGHSAGAIHQAHFLPALLAECARAGAELSIASLSLLAPAVTIDTFAQRLAPLLVAPVGSPARIRDCAIFTMNDDRERRDSTALVYRKSLLYFVRNACEPARNPLLGLETSLRPYLTRHPSHPAWAATATIGGAAISVHWSTGPLLSDRQGTSSDANVLTAAIRHSAFDNDPATMTAVMSRILGNALVVGTAPSPLPVPYEVGVAPTPSTTMAAERESPVRTAPEADRIACRVHAPSHQYALCLGIDEYPTAPLRGCVADAEQWARTLDAVGFRVTTMQNAQCTRRGMEAAIRALLERTPDGGHAIVQFAGHGTQLADASGDDTDGRDEALVPIDHQWAGCLLDDELYEWLLPHASRLRLTLLFDCCHAGTASRVAPPVRGARADNERVRFYFADASTLQAQAVRDAARGSSHAARAALRQTEIETVPWIHVAACLDDQFAYESAGQGHFTRAAAPLLAQVVTDGWSGTRYVQEIAGALAAHRRDQTPRLMATTDGRAQRALF